MDAFDEVSPIVEKLFKVEKSIGTTRNGPELTMAMMTQRMMELQTFEQARLSAIEARTDDENETKLQELSAKYKDKSYFEKMLMTLAIAASRGFCCKQKPNEKSMLHLSGPAGTWAEQVDKDIESGTYAALGKELTEKF